MGERYTFGNIDGNPNARDSGHDGLDDLLIKKEYRTGTKERLLQSVRAEYSIRKV